MQTSLLLTHPNQTKRDPYFLSLKSISSTVSGDRDPYFPSLKSISSTVSGDRDSNFLSLKSTVLGDRLFRRQHE
jgi:hypothetical protein